jgi:hypothetical protein
MILTSYTDALSLTNLSFYEKLIDRCRKDPDMFPMDLLRKSYKWILIELEMPFEEVTTWQLREQFRYYVYDTLDSLKQEYRITQKVDPTCTLTDTEWVVYLRIAQASYMGNVLHANSSIKWEIIKAKQRQYGYNRKYADRNAEHVANIFNYWQKRYLRGPHKQIAPEDVFDDIDASTRDIFRHLAAIVIQKHVRRFLAMRYRYDPYNTFGQYLIRKMFDAQDDGI